MQNCIIIFIELRIVCHICSYVFIDFYMVECERRQDICICGDVAWLTLWDVRAANVIFCTIRLGSGQVNNNDTNKHRLLYAM